jgi:hypothetical protein
VFLNVVSVVFAVRHSEARWVLVALVVSVPLMNLLFDTYGYVRVLGLAHVLVWTPLLVFLLLRRSRIGVKTPFGVWLHALMLTNAISLAIDYVQVARFVMERSSAP